MNAFPRAPQSVIGAVNARYEQLNRVRDALRAIGAPCDVRDAVEFLGGPKHRDIYWL